ncbi:MAG: histidinol dehydrogenase [SAR202 cluster bacterium Io17-Chloro-G2]|nr:MAG: histidinol dehydrogenase [SAR202 cluster bacterium Io17-Chloro-G2]
MELKLIKGTDNAREILDRADLLDMSALPESVAARTRELFGEDVTPEQSVVRMLKEVREEGDVAVRRYAKLLDGADLNDFLVEPKEMRQALEGIPKELRESLELAAQRVTDFHRAVMPRSWVDLEKGLGEMVRPLAIVGLYAPGGTAAYPSTVIMTAVPARVAGVSQVIMATPRRGEEPLNSAVLAAAQIAGVDAVYQVGGVPAIGAMAYGTQSIPKVDKICGPGNVFVSYAKKLVQGQVDIDGIFGPTETIVIADDSANPSFCAADLIAQAEHDTMATAILVTDSESLVRRIEKALDVQLDKQERRDIAENSLKNQGRVVLVESIGQAIELGNTLAPEHMCLMVKDPWAWAGKVENAGGLFLGEFSPEVMGDYIAGPSHVMPTGGTARFSSALSVHQFLRTMPVVGLSPQDFSGLGPAAVHIAHAEGLGAHAGAIQVRLNSLADRFSPWVQI